MDAAQEAQLDAQAQKAALRAPKRPPLAAYNFEGPRDLPKWDRAMVRDGLALYTPGPAAEHPYQCERLEKLRQQLLTQKQFNSVSYRERFDRQAQGAPVENLREVPIILSPGESAEDAEKKFRA
ncbi:hypothetical protein PsorP6_004562 [Peronosclerospora sorghi]|uniref:Uncharacterized protein n=1 Tax=Peronosclerospora sorghi TaxID=230839 RepID=A0ACC0VJW6_9STRA|nr:hypothetical protein PsorP6_004562 [Peronosclerospora sorghi]